MPTPNTPDEGKSAGSVRLQKFLAAHTEYSRRNAERCLIEPGRVKVNGVVVREMGFSIDPLSDVVEVDGARIDPRSDPLCYVMLNKPAGYITAKHDPQGRRCVYELVPKRYAKLAHVGRLDLDSTGLLLFTNDGELAFSLLAPKTHVEKRYRLIVKGRLEEADVEVLRRGITLQDGPCAPAKVTIDDPGPSAHATCIIHEGRKRQVKRMFAAIGHPVLSLHRDAFGAVELGGLDPGKLRPLSANEIQSLLAQADIAR